MLCLGIVGNPELIDQVYAKKVQIQVFSDYQLTQGFLSFVLQWEQVDSVEAEIVVFRTLDLVGIVLPDGVR